MDVRDRKLTTFIIAFGLGLNFDTLDGILTQLQNARKPFFTRGQYGFAVDAFFEGPLGQIYEAVGIKQSILNASQVENWNLCGPI